MADLIVRHVEKIRSYGVLEVSVGRKKEVTEYRFEAGTVCLCYIVVLWPKLALLPNAACWDRGPTRSLVPTQPNKVIIIVIFVK